MRHLVANTQVVFIGVRDTSVNATRVTEEMDSYANVSNVTQ